MQNIFTISEMYDLIWRLLPWQSDENKWSRIGKSFWTFIILSATIAIIQIRMWPPDRLEHSNLYDRAPWFWHFKRQSVSISLCETRPLFPVQVSPQNFNDLIIHSRRVCLCSGQHNGLFWFSFVQDCFCFDLFMKKDWLLPK